MSPVIETERLTRRFGRNEAVSELSFQVPAGSIYALLGPNGAGKSTTIKVLMNLLEPTAGHASVLGVRSTSLGADNMTRIGYVSENQKLPESMTVDQLLAFCKPLYPDWDDALCAELVRRFDLPPRQKIASFSRGMKMKAATVTALAFRPRLLVLDEPFSGLDPLVRDEIVEGMLEMVGKGEWSVLVSSHDLSEIENLADHVGFIRQGRMIASEPIESLQQRFREVEVTLPEPQPLPLEWPSSWLAPKNTERVLRFVESQYDPERTPHQLRKIFSEQAVFTIAPVSLRTIFVALARGSSSQEGHP
jgi:ABC-type multidrug transport system ATPase subunit